MKTIATALVALSVLAGVVAPASAASDFSIQQLDREGRGGHERLTLPTCRTKGPRARARGPFLCVHHQIFRPMPFAIRAANRMISTTPTIS